MRRCGGYMTIGKYRDIGDLLFLRWRTAVIYSSPLVVLGAPHPFALISACGILAYLPLVLLRKLDPRHSIRVD
jgi:hypothetical protein